MRWNAAGTDPAADGEPDTDEAADSPIPEDWPWWSVTRGKRCVMVGGDPQASWSRIAETLLACAIVLIVGHLPMPKGQRGGGVRARLTEAGTAAHAYLAHVLRETVDDHVALVRRMSLDHQL